MRLRTHGPVSARDEEDGDTRRQRREAEPDVQADEKDSRADHHEEIGGELNEALSEELIELVGVVVDPRDQIAGLVLIEEVERQ